MGPRLFSRGRQGRAVFGHAQDRGLQWGLGFLAEEGNTFNPVVRTGERLQWGLGFLAEEGHLAALLGVVVVPNTSMGPRLFSRGRAVPDAGSARRPKLQWGLGFLAEEGPLGIAG